MITETTSSLESALIKGGYARSANDSLFGMPGTGWSPAGPGVPEVPSAPSSSVRVYERNGRAEIGVCVISGVDSRWSMIARFVNVDELFVWCRMRGSLSSSGQRHF